MNSFEFRHVHSHWPCEASCAVPHGPGWTPWGKPASSNRCASSARWQGDVLNRVKETGNVNGVNEELLNWNHRRYYIDVTTLSIAFWLQSKDLIFKLKKSKDLIDFLPSKINLKNKLFKGKNQKSKSKNRSKKWVPEAALAARVFRACLMSLGGFAPEICTHS